MVKLWIPKHIDLKIGAQLKGSEPKHEHKKSPFITISRSFGCDGMELAEDIIKRLNRIEPGWYLFHRTMLSSEEGIELTEERIQQLDMYGHSELKGYIREAIFGMPNQMETVEKLAKITLLLAKEGKVVFLGGGAVLFTQKLTHGVHVRLDAELDWRVNNYQERWQGKPAQQGMDPYQVVQDKSSERESFIKTYMGQDISDLQHYDLIFNNKRMKPVQAGDLTIQLLQSRGWI